MFAAMGLAACVESAPVPAGYVSGGFYQTAYPRMVMVPGYPVYYDPYARANYFFYGGSYWLYQYDNWYSSSWYNGPWGLVGPRYVPYYLLRVPVRYYRAPPPYFRGWHDNDPPHWGEHWGHDWERQHNDWNQWDHRSVSVPAPLPAYQRDYSGDRYPRDPHRQREIHDLNYRYGPHQAAAQPHDPPPGRPPAPVPRTVQQPQPAPAGSPPQWQSHPQARPPEQSHAATQSPRLQAPLPPRKVLSTPAVPTPAPATPSPPKDSKHKPPPPEESPHSARNADVEVDQR